MVDYNTVDWDLLRVEYELFGKTFAEIAIETGIPKGHVSVVAEERGWKIHPLAQELVIQDTDALVTEADSYEAMLEEKLKRLKLIQSELFSPYYAKLEAALLTKAIALATSIQSTSPTATKELKDIASVMQSLLSANGMLGKAAQNGEGNKLVLVVQNKFGDDSKNEDTEIVVEVANGDD